jgi:hypothetical protein
MVTEAVIVTGVVTATVTVTGAVIEAVTGASQSSCMCWY